MEKRSLFSRIFGSDKSTVAPVTSTEVTILNGNKAVFTQYRGDFFNDPDVIACVDAIARNGAKMHPKHIRNYTKDGKPVMETVKDNLYRILSKQPNEIQNAYKFYYQILTQLELYNNSIIVMRKNFDLKVEALYPVEYSEVKFYEYEGKLWVKFKFGSGKERFVPYSECIHLTRFTGQNGLAGGDVVPLTKVLSIKHVLDEGMINAIKTTQSIKGVLKSTKAMLKPEDVKKMRDEFVKDFVENADETGIGGLDATTDFTPVKIEPTTASDTQIKIFDSKVLNYFGVNESIIQSKYNENEWNAFYESVLEPIAIQMSLEFTNKLFTPTEKGYGNEIIFESNRLQYASNNTKIELLRYGNNIMTVNEMREIFNLAPREDGDIIMQDLNHINSDIASQYQTGTDNDGGNENEGN